MARLRFHCIDHGVPEETIALLRNACAHRDIEFVAIDAGTFDFSAARRLGHGDLLYRPAASALAIRVEQLLQGAGVASFYCDALGPFLDCLNGPLLFERAGLPIPRTIYAATPDRDLLRRAVERLGGFPIVAKWLGHSSGVAVLRVDSLPALFSLMDYAGSGANPPLLMECIADATHFRLIVIGDRAVAAYRNAQQIDDFRSAGSDDPADYRIEIDPEMARVAVAATEALGIEMAGVDILRAPDGRLALLEANVPCYYPQAQLVTGVDIAGMMLDHLTRKAQALASADPAKRA